jgi:uncharacterized membrane protein YedE/YeeE
MKNISGSLIKERNHPLKKSNHIPVENNESKNDTSFSGNYKYLLAGIFFGVVFLKAEIISWFRMQEMFRFQSFFMYGVIGSALVTGIITVALIKKFKARTLDGDIIKIAPKQFNKGYIFGGLIFGIGWAITGACPGPLYAQIGGGYSVIIITLLSALAGTWVYGLLRSKLPH